MLGKVKRKKEKKSRELSLFLKSDVSIQFTNSTNLQRNNKSLPSEGNIFYTEFNNVTGVMEKKSLDTFMLSFYFIFENKMKNLTYQSTVDAYVKYVESNDCVFVHVPANMTHHFQPLDLTVNGPAKLFLNQKFKAWYANEVSRQVGNGKIRSLTCTTWDR